MVNYPDGVASDSIRVLIVDDHALHRDGTRRILEQCDDLDVVGDAESGEVALALTNRLHPDVVLMDVRLPAMSGIEATRRIARDHPGVRVLIVTAYDEEEFIRGALESGAAGFMSKAAPGRELIAAVRDAAAGRLVLQPELMQRVLRPRRPARKALALTHREHEVLVLLVEGLHNREIAVRLSIGTRTVERHCDSLYTKLGVGSRTEAVVKALSLEIVEAPDELT